MRKPACGLGFNHEALAVLFFRFGIETCDGDCLDGDGPAKFRIVGAIHLAHGAASQLRVNHVPVQTCAYTSRHDGCGIVLRRYYGEYAVPMVHQRTILITNVTEDC